MDQQKKLEQQSKQQPQTAAIKMGCSGASICKIIFNLLNMTGKLIKWDEKEKTCAVKISEGQLQKRSSLSCCSYYSKNIRNQACPLNYLCVHVLNLFYVVNLVQKSQGYLGQELLKATPQHMLPSAVLWVIYIITRSIG